MKKLIALTLAMLLLLTMASCGKKEETVVETTAVPTTEVPETEEPTTEATTEPAPTEPEWEPGLARAGYGEAVYTTMSRGDEVTVIGEWKDYYVIEGEEVDLLIEKRFVRLDSEDDFEEWKGFAKYSTKVYDNVYLKGDFIAELYQNKQVTVIDGGDGWWLIQWDGNTGYVTEEKISRWPISSGSSGDSGSSGGGSSSSGSSSGSVTGDINLDLVAYYGPPKKDVKDTGVVLADDVAAILCITIRDDELKVTSVGEDECEIYLDGYTATLPRWLVHMEGDEEYKEWTGYAKWGAVVYEEYQMRNELRKLNMNTEMTVLDELEEPGCCVVEIDGEIGYMVLGKISQYKNTGSGSGSGSSDGSGDSGGGSGSTGGASETWTPPVI